MIREKIMAIVLVVMTLLAGGIAMHDWFEQPAVVTQTMTKIVKVPVNVTQVVTETVEKEVPVVNPINLQLKEQVQDLTVLSKASMDMLQDEINDDIDADYVLFEVEAKMEAENWIKKNMVNLLKDNDYFDDGEVLGEYRKSEVSVRKVYDPIIADRNFKDKDLELSFEVKMRAKESGDPVEYQSFTVTVPFEDSKMVSDDIEVELI